MTLTCQDGMDLQLRVSPCHTRFRIGEGYAFLIHTVVHDALGTLRCDHVILLYQHISVFIKYADCRITSRDTLPELLNDLISFTEGGYIDTRLLILILAAVRLTDDQIL